MDLHPAISRKALTCALVPVAAAALMLSASGAASAAGSEPVLKQYSQTLDGWDGYTLPELVCPAGTYLIDKDLAPGRGVPPGVSVDEPGSIGVSGGWIRLDGYATGVRNLSMSNWNPFARATVTVTLHCTADKSKAAFRRN